MKKIVILTLIVALMTPMFGCTALLPEDTGYRHEYMKDPEELSPAYTLQIRLDYQNHLIEKFGEQSRNEFPLNLLWIEKYYGFYNGVEVLYMGDPLGYTQAIRSVTVGSNYITYPNGQELYIYKDSKFYTILEAFQKDIINDATAYDIGKILEVRRTVIL